MKGLDSVKLNYWWMGFVLIPLSLFSTEMSSVSGFVDFDDVLYEWDGFGFNYVETFDAYDFESHPQDYGGFSLLDEGCKQRIAELVFAEEGLAVGLVKMFLGPNHQSQAGGVFDHESSTANMRDFLKRGLSIVEQDGRELEIITTLYGPPGFVTLQKEARGRDLDPEMKNALYQYMASWVKYLQENDFPVRYLSPHNEGEGWLRWDPDGRSGETGKGHDFNLFWPHSQLIDFLKEMPDVLAEKGITGVGVTNGETYGWDRFHSWGYADEIARHPVALKNLSLITSHGFLVWGFKRWNTEHRSNGIRILRDRRPELHAWTTSTSWGKMDANFAREIHGNIYNTGTNGLIPWAGIQNPDKWSGDPNPGCAFRVSSDGSWEIRPGYYYYKQFTQAGRSGMHVARTWVMDSEITLTAFGGNSERGHKDAFVMTHTGDTPRSIQIEMNGVAPGTEFELFRSSEQERTGFSDDERYESLGTRILGEKGVLNYEVPAGSVTTFIEK